MFDKLRERMRTRQAYMNTPVTYEVLGIQSDEKSLQWFRRNFGHQSLLAIFFFYTGFGMILGSTALAIVNEDWTQAFYVGLGMSLVVVFWLLFLRYDSKKAISN